VANGGSVSYIMCIEGIGMTSTKPHSSSAYYCPHCWGRGLPCGLQIRRTGHNPPHGPSVDWWVLTTANAAGTNGLTCFSKHGGAQDIFGHPSDDRPTLLNFRDRASCALTALSSSYTQYLAAYQGVL
jgi:hypothetical protein